MTVTTKITFKILLLAALVAGVLAAGQVSAQDADTQAAGRLQGHPALKDFEQGGGVVSYLGREGSLDGYLLLSEGGGVKTIYMTPEGLMVMGILVDAQGENVTGQQISAYRARLSGGQAAIPGAEKGAASKAEKAYAAAEQAAWVAVGDASAPYVYMFMNVTCAHCQRMFTDLEKAVAAGQIQLRLIPFGSLPANRTSGAALLSVDDPGAAWRAFIRGDVSQLATDKVAPGAAEKVAANTALVAEHRIKGPPFTLYRRPSDGAVAGIVGQPRSLMTLLAELMPLPGEAP